MAAIQIISPSNLDDNFVVTVTLPSSGWSTTVPYTQSINIQGMNENWVPGLPVKHVNENIDADKLEIKALACLNKIESSNGVLTFICYKKKPEVGFTIDIPQVIGRNNNMVDPATGSVYVSPKLGAIQATDTYGIISEAGADTNSQDMLNTIVNKVITLEQNLDDRSYVVDLFEEIKATASKRMVRYDVNTLNTPYKAGICNITSGLAIISTGSTTYATILCIPDGGAETTIYFCNKTNGTWSEWNSLSKASELGKSIYASNLLETTKNKTTLYHWDADTLNTPYTDDLTTFFTGMAICVANNNYKSIIAVPKGTERIYVRHINNGVDGGWTLLAHKKDLRNMQADRVQVPLVANGIATVDVVFDKPYNENPLCFASIVTAYPGQRHVVVQNITATGMTIAVKNELEATTDVWIHWFAIERP